MAVEACQLLAYSGQVHPQPIITPPSSFLNNKLVSHAILTLGSRRRNDLARITRGLRPLGEATMAGGGRRNVVLCVISIAGRTIGIQGR